MKTLLVVDPNVAVNFRMELMLARKHTVWPVSIKPARSLYFVCSAT